MDPKNEEKLKLVGPERSPGGPCRETTDPGQGREGDGVNKVVDALRELPEVSAPVGLWPRVKEDFVTRHRVISHRRWVAAACAASILVVALGWIQLRPGTPTATADSEALEAAEAVEELTAASRQLEEVLSSRQLQAPVLTAGEAIAIVQLEDRLTLVDEAIYSLGESGGQSAAEAREAVFLWSHRVELLDALVEARGVPRSRGNIVFATTERR